MQRYLMGEPWLSLNGLLKVDPASCFCTDCPGPAQYVVACYTLQQGDVSCLNLAAMQLPGAKVGWLHLGSCCLVLPTIQRFSNTVFCFLQLAVSRYHAHNSTSGANYAPKQKENDA